MEGILCPHICSCLGHLECVLKYARKAKDPPYLHEGLAISNPLHPGARVGASTSSLPRSIPAGRGFQSTGHSSQHHSDDLEHNIVKHRLYPHPSPHFLASGSCFPGAGVP